MPTALFVLAAQRSDGPFRWILIGAVLGLALGFAYAAARRVLERRRR